ncbi:41848_t:CDS:2, partial [Gigaspora margarita]
KLSKQAKNTNIDEDAENEVAREKDEGTKIELSEAIKMLQKFFMKENISQTMDHMKKLMLFICYLLASLHNLKINMFKFDIANYLDLVGTSNKGINMIANLSVTLTARSVNRNKRRISNAYKKYTGIVDYELIVRHLDERFIVNFGVPYYFHSQDSKKICSEDELIDRLMVHSYNDRIENKTNNQHIWDSILFDFIKNNLKAEQLWIEAHCIFQNRKDNAFRQYFVNLIKYSHALKKLDTLSQKCSKHLLDMFSKIYQSCFKYSSIINVSSDDIYSYKLPSLGYKISDCYFPQRFVTAKKPNGIVLACRHGYHNHCLQICQFKCLRYLEYLNDKIIENINMLMKSLKKKLDEKESDLEDVGTIVDDNSDNADDI